MRRRRVRRRPARQGGFWLSAAVGISGALLCISALSRAMAPALLSLSQAQVSNAVTGAVTRRVEDTLSREGVSYQDMVRVEKNNQGQIVAMTTDTAGMNRLRNLILEGVLEDLEALGQESVSVPVGNLTPWDALSGTGPAIRVGVLTAGTGEAEFRSQFSSAGVNQTRHQIELAVTVHVTLLLPSGGVERDITATVPVAETIIVGAVPQQYISIGTGEP